MSLSFPRTKPRYKTVDGILYRIKRKRTYLGMEEKLEEIPSKIMFPKGWAIIRMESCYGGVFHFFEKNKYHSLCRITSNNDNPKKRFYIDPKTFHSQKYRPCKNCLRLLKFWKVTGIHPDKRDTENVKH